MKFFDIALEIRLKIYSELLVLPEPIVFVADYGPSSPPLFRSGRDGLCPALLCVNTYSIPIIASDSLKYSPPHRRPRTAPTSPHSFTKSDPKQAIFAISAFPFLPSTIPSLIELGFTKRILKTWNSSEIPVHAGSPIAAEALDLLDTHFKNIPSLKEIVIDFEVYPEQDPSDDLTKKIYHDYGWTIKVTKLPKKKWISLDDRVEFDNEEDCQAYDNEQFLIEERQRQREEEEQWLEEYYERRRDPYRKNDSDYD